MSATLTTPRTIAPKSAARPPVAQLPSAKPSNPAPRPSPQSNTPRPAAVRPGPNVKGPTHFDKKPAGNSGTASSDKPDHPILFQSFFRSVGSRTYAAQIKQATNSNQYLVLTEGRRDDKTGDIRKLRVNIFSEDFDAFFNLLRDASQYLKANPLPKEFQEKRKRMWENIRRKQEAEGKDAVPKSRSR